MLTIGGTSLQKCMDDLDSEGADIMIGTPGRTMDILSRCRLISLRNLEVKYDIVYYVKTIDKLKKFRVD